MYDLSENKVGVAVIISMLFTLLVLRYRTRQSTSMGSIKLKKARGFLEDAFQVVFALGELLISWTQITWSGTLIPHTELGLSPYQQAPGQMLTRKLDKVHNTTYLLDGSVVRPISWRI